MKSPKLIPRVVASTLLAATVAVAVGERRPAATTPVQQAPRYASAVVGVRVDVLVTDADTGRPVGGLTASDFELRDNGVLQKTDAANLGDAPVDVVLSLDTSASILGRKLTDLQAATRELLAELRPADKVALTTFNHAVIARLPLGTDVGVVGAVVDAIAPTGATSLLDGIYVAMAATESDAARSFVLVFTDGRDTTSWLEPDELIEGAKRSRTVIYVVASSGARRWAPLKTVTEVTGGHMIEIESSAQIAAEFKKILKDFRSRYLLTFTPTGVERGGYHRLDVRVRHRGMKVTARPGYTG